MERGAWSYDPKGPLSQALLNFPGSPGSARLCLKAALGPVTMLPGRGKLLSGSPVCLSPAACLG